MVSSSVFITYMIATTIAIISLYIYIIKGIKRNIELLDLIQMIDNKHLLIEKELSNIINEK